MDPDVEMDVKQEEADGGGPRKRRRTGEGPETITLTVQKGSDGSIGLSYQLDRIVGVVPGSPAEMAGFTTGMRLLRIANRQAFAMISNKELFDAAPSTEPFTVVVAPPRLASEARSVDASLASGRTGEVPDEDMSVAGRSLPTASLPPASRLESERPPSPASFKPSEAMDMVSDFPVQDQQQAHAGDEILRAREAEGRSDDEDDEEWGALTTGDSKRERWRRVRVKEKTKMTDAEMVRVRQKLDKAIDDGDISAQWKLLAALAETAPSHRQLVATQIGRTVVRIRGPPLHPLAKGIVRTWCALVKTRPPPPRFVINKKYLRAPDQTGGWQPEEVPAATQPVPAEAAAEPASDAVAPLVPAAPEAPPAPPTPDTPAPAPSPAGEALPPTTPALPQSPDDVLSPKREESFSQGFGTQRSLSRSFSQSQRRLQMQGTSGNYRDNMHLRLRNALRTPDMDGDIVEPAPGLAEAEAEQMLTVIANEVLKSLERVREQNAGSRQAQLRRFNQILINISDPRNKELRERVIWYYTKNAPPGSVSAHKLVHEMSVADMANPETRKLRGDQMEYSMNAINTTTKPAETNQFKCGSCGKRRTTYFQLQTRSADEPMTTFVSCLECGKNWKFC
eukprot:TRINITY_DN7383_c0_g1_i1.p1 TRINITY_DN7383_c0_g1~~TRINITY_DN7383_c0_g1_i1.p1  ORF type:complete len:622 (+),score=184.26 TRINITY_DN7383_c0_g1_i1:59-1924(+)